MISPQKKTEFIALFDEFVRDYLSQPQGQSHLGRYDDGRAQGRRNFDKIVAAANRREDVTDLVLRLLLPYTDSATHRASGVWIHIAGAIQGDIKEWFQGAGWTSPEDWPKVAQAIFGFVSRCSKDPKDLELACREFADLPYTTGFQTGLLTPILNAVRPDDFMIVNNKSRRLINYFTDSTFEQRLTDYPGTNAAGRSLVAEFTERMQEAGQSSARPTDLFDVFAHWLVAIRKHSFGRIRYWKIAPGENAYLWEEWHKNGYIAIGWDELGDMSGISRAEFDARVEQVRETHPNWTKVGLNQVWEFAHIKEGEQVVTNRGTTELLGIGTVTAPYNFTPGVEYGHRIPVEWDDVTSRQINEGGWRRTLVELKPEKFEQLRKSSPSSGPPANPYTLADCANETDIDEDKLSQWLRAIERKGQAILYGPPGTGKTYVAERLARHLSSEGDGFWKLVQFHPSYAYEDFIQGIRPAPRPDGGAELSDGQGKVS
jgi:5-methylcytosine-specific restriction protein B